MPPQKILKKRCNFLQSRGYLATFVVCEHTHILPISKHKIELVSGYFISLAIAYLNLKLSSCDQGRWEKILVLLQLKTIFNAVGTHKLD